MKVALPLTFFREDKQLLSFKVGSVNSTLFLERCFKLLLSSMKIYYNVFAMLCMFLCRLVE